MVPLFRFRGPASSGGSARNDVTKQPSFHELVGGGINRPRFSVAHEFAIGTKRTSPSALHMSALGGKADIGHCEMSA